MTYKDFCENANVSFRIEARVGDKIISNDIVGGIDETYRGIRQAVEQELKAQYEQGE